MILRKLGKLITQKPLASALLGAMLLAVAITGCASSAGPEDGRNPGVPTATQVAAERGDGDSRGEHDSREQAKEHGIKPEGEGSEHGAGLEGSQADGEQGPGDEGGRESREAEMSSPIIPLGQSWSGALGGLAVSMQYDAETRTVHGTVQNTLSQKLCYVQAEPHIKSGTRTVGELGPEKMGHLNPGQGGASSLAVASEPELAGVSYDGYVVHMEAFDCSGPGPSAHSGESAEGSGEHRGGEGRSESGGADEKEGIGAAALAPGQTLNMSRSGARLALGYDAASNSFEGTVENTTGGILDSVRVEVHLSNGTELGPTTPTNVAPGEVLTISLPATEQSFTGWTAHAEVGGGGEPGGEHGRDEESRGEYESNENTSGEHGTGEESGGEPESTSEPSGEHGTGEKSGGEHESGENHQDRD